MQVKIDEDRFIEYQKRFVNGEQFITIDAYGNIIDTDEGYYWQNKKVFNHLKLLVEKAIKSNVEEDLIYGANGLVALLMPFQQAYNSIKNKELDYIDKTTYGVICVEEGSIDVDELCEDGVPSGKVIVYRQGSSEPTIITSKLDTEYYLRSESACLQEMYEITSDFISLNEKINRMG